MIRRDKAVLDQVRAASAKHRAEKARADQEWVDALRRAVATGVSKTAIAEAAGISRPWLYELLEER